MLLPLAALTLAMTLLPGCRKEEEKLFAELDLNQDRWLSLPEIEETVAGGFFRTYDADRDGVITLEEWRRRDPQGNGSFFHSRDGNRDGRITAEEAVAAVRKSGFAREVFEQADRNGNARLERREAMVWMADHPEVIARLRLGN